MRNLTAIALAAVLLGGCAQGRAAPRGDPAFRVAAAVLALERSGRGLTPQQAKEVLPLLDVLRNLRPEEQDVAQRLLARFDALLTPTQKEALRTARERLQERIRSAPRPGPVDPERAAEFRRRLVGQAMQLLERRARGR
ncbi:MAG: hypothetical protein QN193_09555 [Armatimonadota bacterium]|nr:hypothetical protein [Armatimonadota bacterium]MDR7444805.1 hypothetical protein [Armatimonadota bacterium]MDR7570839.1 hypothetical protein [Armatimonadota bacterium]MDR7615136.1 hypothetical protein [Armatimonadota bacterium]